MWKWRVVLSCASAASSVLFRSVRGLMVRPVGRECVAAEWDMARICNDGRIDGSFAADGRKCDENDCACACVFVRRAGMRMLDRVRVEVYPTVNGCSLGSEELSGVGGENGGCMPGEKPNESPVLYAGLSGVSGGSMNAELTSQELGEPVNEVFARQKLPRSRSEIGRAHV